MFDFRGGYNDRVGRLQESLLDGKIDAGTYEKLKADLARPGSAGDTLSRLTEHLISLQQALIGGRITLEQYERLRTHLAETWGPGSGGSSSSVAIEPRPAAGAAPAPTPPAPVSPPAKPAVSASTHLSETDPRLGRPKIVFNTPTFEELVQMSEQSGVHDTIANHPELRAKRMLLVRKLEELDAKQDFSKESLATRQRFTAILNELG